MLFHLIGFECNVMDGGTRFFQRVQTIKTESAANFLRAHNCSLDGLRQRILDAGLALNNVVMPRDGDVIARRKTTSTKTTP